MPTRAPDGAKLIVNAALTGMVPSKADNPATPVTPDEIAADARRVADVGASVVHLHARDEVGVPTWRPDVYREIVHRVRERCEDVVVCVSTSGRTFKAFDERAAVLELDGDETPELASLTLGSLNFPQQASVNEPEMIRRLVDRMYERGITPLAMPAEPADPAGARTRPDRSGLRCDERGVGALRARVGVWRQRTRNGICAATSATTASATAIAQPRPAGLAASMTNAAPTAAAGSAMSRYVALIVSPSVDG